MTKVKIKNQKGIEQAVKADVAKSEIKKAKQDLIDLLGSDMVEKMYKDKVKYEVYCLKMLNIRAKGKITNYDVLARGKGPITLKNREPLSEEILGATTQRDTESYYPKRYWELLPKEILGAITQRETRMSYGKME
ncbi:hypothetical protein Tco_0898309, partial [Tanacetum coccineum]